MTQRRRQLFWMTSKKQKNFVTIENDDQFSIGTYCSPINANEVVKYFGFLLDKKLTWKNHIQFVVEKLCIAKDIMSKLRYYLSFRIYFRNLHFGTVYSQVRYKITS